MNWPLFILKRLSLIFLSLLILSLLIFILMNVLPGDVARTIVGRDATEQQVQIIRERLGLDRPVHIRYFDWLVNALAGNFGVSITLRAPVSSIIMRRAGYSLLLAMGASIVGFPLAIGQGFIAGLRRPRWLDHVLSKSAILISSLPEFLVALLLILLLSETAGWLPGTSMLRSGQTPLSNPRILVLPILSLVLIMTAYNLRITRASVIKVLNSDFIVAAELKGISLLRILLRHLAPNALLPTITVAAGYLGWLFGGLLVVEAVFAYPGIGNLIYSAARSRDVPLLQASVLLVACIRMFANMGADILYRMIDPRVDLS